MEKVNDMSNQIAQWYRDQGEYVTGGLFGLLALDIFMFLVHCITEGTTEGYSLATLIILIGLYIVAGAERLYAQQEVAH